MAIYNESIAYNASNITYNGVFIATGSGSISISGSATAGTIAATAVVTLTPSDPLPTSGVPTGSFAVSSSVPPKPYFWDGTTWNALF